MKKKFGLVLSVVAAGALIFSGCGGSSSSTPEAVAYNGKLVDSEVAGVAFECGTVSGVTAADGTFGTCPANSIATFSIGGLTLGSSGVTGDGIFFITDIVGVARDAIDNEEVLKIAVLLQSLDADGDPSNGISLPADAAATVDTLIGDTDSILDLSLVEVETLATDAVAVLVVDNPAMDTVTVAEAEANLADTLETIDDIAPPPAPTGSEGGS